MIHSFLLGNPLSHFEPNELTKGTISIAMNLKPSDELGVRSLTITWGHQEIINDKDWGMGCCSEEMPIRDGVITGCSLFCPMMTWKEDDTDNTLLTPGAQSSSIWAQVCYPCASLGTVAVMDLPRPKRASSRYPQWGCHSLAAAKFSGHKGESQLTTYSCSADEIGWRRQCYVSEQALIKRRWFGQPTASWYPSSREKNSFWRGERLNSSC